MERAAERVPETVVFATSDGVELEGDLLLPEEPARSAAVVCHPHPQYGGNRHDHVVAACWRALADAGHAALRFDFRSDFGGGVAERLDVTAALDLAGRRCSDARLAVVGYSFGAMVALGLTDARVAATALVAPPLTAMPVEATPMAPTLVLTPVGDQFTPPDAAEPIVDEWRTENPDVTFEPITMTDHFLHGRTAHVAARVVTWLDDLHHSEV